ncbi:MAG: helix-turn-helix domain-containing protein [Nanoarchaeota archaeon]|nr:helix-turn-helix domain-containing protein [Nanoarchaeota archaeon]
MHEKLLEDAGLTKNEAKAYLTLLRIGKSPSGKIVKEAKIAGGKVYETLYKLLDKGLVEVVIEQNVKQFIAADPQSILLYLEERKEQISEQAKKLGQLVPELQKIKEFTEPVENVYLVKGFRGIKPVVYDALQKSSGEVRIMGVRSSKDNVFNTFWQHWHHERVRLHKPARMIFTDRGTDYWKFFEKLKLTKIRSVTELSPSAIMVIDENSFIFSYEKEFTCIHIRSAAIAKSFSSFFEGLWTMGKA